MYRPCSKQVSKQSTHLLLVVCTWWSFESTVHLWSWLSCPLDLNYRRTVFSSNCLILMSNQWLFIVWFNNWSVWPKYSTSLLVQTSSISTLAYLDNSLLWKVTHCKQSWMSNESLNEDLTTMADYLTVFSRGMNFALSALIFNIFPTLFEISLVSGILVSLTH